MSKKRIKIFIVLLLLLLIGIIIWWKLFFVPIPKYIPKDNKWQLVSKQSEHAWMLPRIYCRYKVNSTQLSAKSKLSKNISSFAEWDKIDEHKSEDLIAQIENKWGKEITTDEIVELLVQLAVPRGQEFALRTQKPFITLYWSRHLESSSKHNIVARIIGTSSDHCIVEIWDHKIFD